MQLDLVKNVSKASVFRNSASVGGSEFGDLPILEKTISITTMLGKIARNNGLQQVDSYDFDIFEVVEAVGRENTLTIVMFKIMSELPHQSGYMHINNEKLITFLSALYKGYKREVQYHNDLHGADVAQAMYMFFKQGNLAEIAQLNYLD